LRREENQRTQRKTLGSRARTNNKLNPHMTLGPGNEPRTHWWEASALTTAPPLLPTRVNFETAGCAVVLNIVYQGKYSIMSKNSKK